MHQSQYWRIACATSEQSLSFSNTRMDLYKPARRTFSVSTSLSVCVLRLTAGEMLRSFKRKVSNHEVENCLLSTCFASSVSASVLR